MLYRHPVKPDAARHGLTAGVGEFALEGMTREGWVEEDAPLP